jgi:hypothetical protein
MNSILFKKMEGLHNELEKFDHRVKHFELRDDNATEFTDMIKSEMEDLDYDEVKKDEVGNVIGTIKGINDKEALVLISNVTLPSMPYHSGDRNQLSLFEGNKTGIVAGIYTGGLLKRSLASLTGNLYVCSITRRDCCGFGIRYLFDTVLKNKKIKGVILCEPTDYKILIGNKGRLEYEIIVSDPDKRYHFAEDKQKFFTNEVGLLNNLKIIADRLPSDVELGRSSLNIKKIARKGTSETDEPYEMHVQVDRTYIPNEASDQILQNARYAAQNVYREMNVNIDALINEDRIMTNTGRTLREVKEYKPWKMAGYHPFVVDSLKVLQENNFDAAVGYWKNNITEGSFTNGELHIPTIGFGAGREDGNMNVDIESIEKSIYGKALIIYRQIGIPTFGWSDDEI